MKLVRYYFKRNGLRIHFVCLIFFLRYNKPLYNLFIRLRKKCLLKRKLRNICNHKGKIKVGFLVSEQAKWCYQSVYDAFNKDPRFEPIILVTKLYNEHLGRKTYYKTMKDCFNFFKSKGLNVVYAYDDEAKKYIDISKFDLGILFYQQPWEIDYCQSPMLASVHSITCYCSYGYELLNYSASYTEEFHRQLDIMFTSSDDVTKYINSKVHNTSNLINSGNPKLDQYDLDENIKKNKKITIIYAPHHSFEKNGIKCATFDRNGIDILRIAKSYSDKINWIFKPHPRFKHAVIINNIMSADEIDKYYKEWEKIGSIYEGGDYIKMFQNSDGMITDCVSFLAEYLPSKKPLLHLFNDKTDWNDVGKKIIQSFYKVISTEQLVELIQKVLIEKQDYKKQDRLEVAKSLFVENQKSGDIIFSILIKVLKGGL